MIFHTQDLVTQNRCGGTSVHVENREHKTADVQVHVINNNMVCGRICTQLVLKPLTAKNCLSISILCIAPFL